MADKTPVRVVYNASSVATGLAEYQSGETIGYAFGGTGLSSLGSAGSVLRVNGAGNALEWGGEDIADILSVGSTLTAPSNANFTITTAGTGDIVLNDVTIHDSKISANRSNEDLTLSASGTGNIVLGAVTVNGTTLSSADSSKITLAEAVDITGALTSSTSLKLATGATVTGILDEDAMGTNSATQLATQQSIKAYVDGKDHTSLSGTTNNTVTTVTGANAIQGEANLQFDGTTLAVSGSVTVSGNLTVSGDYFTTTTTNTTIEDNLLELNTGISQSLNDSGIIIERGSTGDNAGIIWDESADKFVLGTTTATAADKSGGITIVPGTLEVASLTADSITITDNIISTNASNTNLELSANSSGIVHVTDSFKVGTGATVTTILDEDAMGSNSATALATQQSIVAYVAAQITAEDLDFQGDSGGALSIDLNSETLDIAGGTGIDTSGSSNTLTVAIDSTVTTLTGSQTLTNKTLTAPTITATSTTVGGKIKFLEGTDNGTNGVTLVGAASTADVDLILPAAADTLVGKATTDTFTNKTFDLGGTGNSLTGSLAEFNSALQSDSFVSLTGSETLTNKTLTSPVLNTGVSGTAVLDEDAMGSNSATQLATQQSIKAYADTKAVLTGTTNNTITTVTGAHAFQGEANLTFDGTDMLVASSGKIKFTDANEAINSDGTNLILTSGGTTYKIPVADGSSGQALVTDGAGTLSFGSVSAVASDDSLATARNNKNLAASIRTIDSFNITYADSVLYFGVQNDLVNEKVSAQMFSVVNNDSAAFIGANRGVETAGGTNFPTLTVDVSNTMVRLRAVGTSAECKMSFYRIPLSTANTADATSGNTVVTSNTDVDSASESIDTWAHASYRAAKYFISVDNNAKTEISAVEALVVHNGSDAFIIQYGGVDSGSNELLTLTAAISGSNVVLSASGGEANLNLTIHKILLKDSMTAAENDNQKAIGAVTVSSTATAIDTMDLDTANGAVYYVVSKNATEGTYGVAEVFAAATPGLAVVTTGGYVSTKGTGQLEFTAAFDTASENAYELFASSTSGGSTIVNAYRINCLAG